MATTIPKGVTSTGLVIANNGLYVYGTASNTTINIGGWMYVSSGGVARDTSVSSGGWIVVSSGGRASGGLIRNGGSAYISGGVIRNIQLEGAMGVYSGGVVSGVSADNGGEFGFPAAPWRVTPS